MADYNYKILCEKIFSWIHTNEIKSGGQIFCVDLGLTKYDDAYRLQLDLFEHVREGNTGGIVLLLEHPPVITLGSNRSRKNLIADESILKIQGIELVQSDRGGDITLHAPGQLVCYPVFNLSHFGRDLILFVTNLEQVIINVLSEYGIEGRRIEKLRGVFVGSGKIASVGIRVRKWVTLHGFSFNINTDLGYFKNIISCGLKDFKQTSMQEILGKEVPLNRIKEAVIRNMELVFKVRILNITIA